MAKAFGIKPKNDEQKYAITALSNPEIDLVILEGCAGTGKTFISVACALEQVMEKKLYSKIIFTRAPVAVGYDMGFLPGTIEEKMRPWLGALIDNLEVLGVDEKDVDRYMELVAIMHMRGRSFYKKLIIIDEVQNLDLHEIKTIITRAGEDTKIICMGDLGQIDNKKLTKENNGLIHLIKASIDCDFARTVHLPTGVRSRLCAWAADKL